MESHAIVILSNKQSPYVPPKLYVFEETWFVSVMENNS